MNTTNNKKSLKRVKVSKVRISLTIHRLHKVLIDSANALKEVDHARESVAWQKSEMELAKLEYASICQSEFQFKPVNGCPPGCTCFDCQMKTAIQLSLQDDLQMNKEEDSTPPAVKDSSLESKK